jgi:hypothetical protein
MQNLEDEVITFAIKFGDAELTGCIAADISLKISEGLRLRSVGSGQASASCFTISN